MIPPRLGAQELDLLADVVEETGEYLDDAGLLEEPGAEFLATRLIEAGGRGRTVGEAARWLGVTRSTLTKRCDKAGLPSPGRLVALGRVLPPMRLYIRGGIPLEEAARRWGWAGPDLSNSTALYVGRRPTSLVGHDWFEIVDGFVLESWPASPARP